MILLMVNGLWQRREFARDIGWDVDVLEDEKDNGAEIDIVTVMGVG